MFNGRLLGLDEEGGGQWLGWVVRVVVDGG